MALKSVSEPSSPRPEQAARPAVKHVAIIMDGNGRWAAARGLARSAGHKEGAAAARRAVEAARDLGLTHLTLYSFSTENWRRPAAEIADLMGLLRQFISDDLPTLRKEGVRVRIIGDRENLTPDLKLLVRQAEKETEGNARFTLNIAFNYGGRDELVRAARALAAEAAAGRLKPSDIDEARLAAALDTVASPDPDFVIRTSGEMRISNFLLFQAAYSEFFFLDVLWPDFTAAHLAGAIEAFAQRERRFGGVTGA